MNHKKPTPHFDALNALNTNITALQARSGAVRYFADEVTRFRTIAGTLLAMPAMTLDKNPSPGERSITHVLLRSVLEGYFLILYLFDDASQTTTRFREAVNKYEDEYKKLIDEGSKPLLLSFFQTIAHKLEPVGKSWPRSPKLADVRTLLGAVRNDNKQRLDYLYFFYRITSFDVHGRVHLGLFEDVFGKPGNFPVLDVRAAIELVANQYLVVLGEIEAGTFV